jgi:hypothetical protein
MRRRMVLWEKECKFAEKLKVSTGRKLGLGVRNSAETFGGGKDSKISEDCTGWEGTMHVALLTSANKKNT